MQKSFSEAYQSLLPQCPAGPLYLFYFFRINDGTAITGGLQILLRSDLSVNTAGVRPGYNVAQSLVLALKKVTL